MPPTDTRRPRWIGIPVRVLLTTVVVTLLAFAVSLLLSILGAVVYSQIEHVSPNMPYAYRYIAFPFAITVGVIVLALSLTMEIRHYRRRKAQASTGRGEVLTGMTAPRIAIPIPHSNVPEYVQRALPQYEEAVRHAGGMPVRIELDQTPAQVLKEIEGCDAVLLPGSGADVDPKKYSAVPHEKTATADTKRETVDELLLKDAYALRKPILGICYGLQALNVFRSGTLVQDIESTINHEAGRKVPKAHTIDVEPGSQLAGILGGSKDVPVNSSHHQSADVIGEGLRVVARSPLDGVIEALEGTLPGHFVVAVQWHPERSVNDDAELAEPARKIFSAFIAAARAKQAELTATSENRSRP